MTKHKVSKLHLLKMSVALSVSLRILENNPFEEKSVDLLVLDTKEITDHAAVESLKMHEGLAEINLKFSLKMSH